jgi:hypothetical protein
MSGSRNFSIMVKMPGCWCTPKWLKSLNN